MVRLYVKEHGWRSIHEAYEVLLMTKPNKIGIGLVLAIAETNTVEMRKQGL